MVVLRGGVPEWHGSSSPFALLLFLQVLLPFNCSKLFLYNKLATGLQIFILYIVQTKPPRVKFAVTIYLPGEVSR